MIGKKRQCKTKSKTKISFLMKLYTILNDGHYSDYIQWSKDGLSLIIFDQNLFTKKVLPRFFKHGNFSSFVRQLNMYNFHKIKSKKGEQKYMHEEFHKSTDIEKIKLIKKKPKFDEDIIISIKNKNLCNKKSGETSIDNKNSIEEQKELFEKFEKLEEETKFKNYEYILKNGELPQNLNNIILLDLLDNSKEKIEMQKQVQIRINNLIAQNKYLIEQLQISNNQLIIQKKNSSKMKGMILYLIKRMQNMKHNQINIEQKINCNDIDQKLINLINKYTIYKNKNKQLQNEGNYSIISKNNSSFKSPIIEKNANFELDPNCFLEIYNHPPLNDFDYINNADRSSLQNSYALNNLKGSRNSKYSRTNKNNNQNKLFGSLNSNISILKY